MARKSKVDWLAAKQFFFSAKNVTLQDVAIQFHVGYSYTLRRADAEKWRVERDRIWSEAEKGAIEEMEGSIKDMVKRHSKIARFLQAAGLNSLKKRLQEIEEAEANGGKVRKIDDSILLALVKEGLQGERELYPKQMQIKGDVELTAEGLSDELREVAYELIYRKIGRTRSPLHGGDEKPKEGSTPVDDGQHPDTESGKTGLE